MVYITGGEYSKAISLAYRPAVARTPDACDVVGFASNQALFMVFHAVALAAKVLDTWQKSRMVDLSSDSDQSVNQGFPAWVQVQLLDVRDTLLKALAATRPDGRMGLSPDGDAWQQVTVGVTEIRKFVSGLCDRGVQHFPKRANGNNSSEEEEAEGGDDSDDDDDL